MSRKGHVAGVPKLLDCYKLLCTDAIYRTDVIYHGQCNGPMRVHVALGTPRARRLGVFERQFDILEWNKLTDRLRYISSQSTYRHTGLPISLTTMDGSLPVGHVLAKERMKHMARDNESKVLREREEGTQKKQKKNTTKGLGIPEVWAADRLGSNGPSRNTHTRPIPSCRFVWVG